MPQTNPKPRQKLIYQHQDSSFSLSSSIDDDTNRLMDFEERSPMIPTKLMKKRYILEEHDENINHMQQNSWLLILKKLGVLMDILSRMPLPPANVGGIAVATLMLTLFGPKTLVQTLIYPAYRHCIGGLYPAYASYKAVRSKNVREYVKWMMYWIVLATFSAIEQMADLCLTWLPFYYEVKILLILWLLSPATKGSSMLYKKFLHPALARREQEIDEALSVARDKGYRAVLQLGSKATNALLNTAIKSSGNLMHQLRKTHSLSDIPEAPSLRSGSDEDYIDETEEWSDAKRANISSSILRRKSDISRQRPLSYSEDNYSREKTTPKISRKASEESSGYSSSASTEPRTYPKRGNNDLTANSIIPEDLEYYEDQDKVPYQPSSGNKIDCKSYFYKNVTITDVTNLEDVLEIDEICPDVKNNKMFDKVECDLDAVELQNSCETSRDQEKVEVKEMPAGEQDVLNTGKTFSSKPPISDPNWSKFKPTKTTTKEIDIKSSGSIYKLSTDTKNDSDDSVDVIINLDSDEETYYDTSEIEDSYNAENVVSGNISIKISVDEKSNLPSTSNENNKVNKESVNKKVHVIGKKKAPEPPNKEKLLRKIKNLDDVKSSQTKNQDFGESSKTSTSSIKNTEIRNKSPSPFPEEKQKKQSGLSKLKGKLTSFLGTPKDNKDNVSNSGSSQTSLRSQDDDKIVKITDSDAKSTTSSVFETDV
ncbi:uncharacterized protein LOC113363030 [Ctenocephalides felis]|uniref:uncharacterized protein LOC113363030 n=1 Tax=Ctenocephalides felis TaxID=7515 RepID=UPI000E6E30DC|nr:uncharacterized protein LOC113363030 [Ctenocephalides felis]